MILAGVAFVFGYAVGAYRTMRMAAASIERVGAAYRENVEALGKAYREGIEKIGKAAREAKEKGGAT